MNNQLDVKKKKVLVIHTTFRSCGGVERFLLNFCVLFPSDQYEVDLLLFDDDQDNACMFDMIPSNVNVLPFLKRFSRWSEELMKELEALDEKEVVDIRNFVRNRNMDEDFKKLSLGTRHDENWKYLKEICPQYSGYDIAIAFTNTLPLKIVAEKVDASKKYAFSHIDVKGAIETLPDNESLYISEKPYYEKVDGIVCIAHQNAESFKKFYPELADKVKVLINVNNKALMMKQALEFYPREYNLQQFKILTVARVCQQKGIDLLIESAKRLKDNGITFKWYILGRDNNDAYSRHCHKMIENFGLKDYICILGERSNPFPYYKNCDLYVQTSYFEGRPLSIEEAMTLDCPIVTTDFSSAREQINDGVNGRICPIEPIAVAETIIELFKNPSECQRFSDNNAHYDGTKGIEEYLAYFR